MCGYMCGCGNLTAREGVVKIALLSVDAESRHLVCLRPVSPAHRGKGPAEHACYVFTSRARSRQGHAPSMWHWTRTRLSGNQRRWDREIVTCRNNCCAYVHSRGGCGYHRAPAVYPERYRCNFRASRSVVHSSWAACPIWFNTRTVDSPLKSATTT